MNILNYIKKYGDKSFLEKEFTVVDNVLFACLSYIDFEGVVSNDFHNKITMEIAAKKYFENNSIKKEISAVRNALEILKYMMNTKRYKDILIYNYQYVSNRNCQFGAVSFDLDDNTTYISYEGTDDLISGWREDCLIAYNKRVLAQDLAIKYLNRFSFKRKKLIIGGHSKGGNLSIMASMYTNFLVRRNIISIYSNDGLGIRKEELESNRYLSIKDRVTKIIPNYSIVGHLLYSDNNYKIIKSTKKSQASHNPSTWVVNDDHFEEAEISRFATVFKKTVDVWSTKYSIDSKLKLVDSVFYICDSNSITSLKQIKVKFLVKMIMDSRLIDNDVKLMFKDFYKQILSINKQYKKGDKSEDLDII